METSRQTFNRFRQVSDREQGCSGLAVTTGNVFEFLDVFRLLNQIAISPAEFQTLKIETGLSPRTRRPAH